eukprot:3679050-Prymnesium_polylepis.1
MQVHAHTELRQSRPALLQVRSAVVEIVSIPPLPFRLASEARAHPLQLCVGWSAFWALGARTGQQEAGRYRLAIDNRSQMPLRPVQRAMPAQHQKRSRSDRSDQPARTMRRGPLHTRLPCSWHLPDRERND